MLSSALSITSSSILFLASRVPAVQHVQGGGSHTWSLAGESAYLPCVRSCIRNMVRCLLCRSFDCSIEVGQGDIIRISPNEVSSRVHMFMSRLGNRAHCRVSSQLHFARPTVYNEIYNPQNKWDKDYEYYRAFDLDKSFFTQTDYLKSKHSRALISNLFSRSATSRMQHLIRGQVRSMYILLRYLLCLIDL